MSQVLQSRSYGELGFTGMFCRLLQLSSHRACLRCRLLSQSLQSQLVDQSKAQMMRFANPDRIVNVMLAFAAGCFSRASKTAASFAQQSTRVTNRLGGGASSKLAWGLSMRQAAYPKLAEEGALEIVVKTTIAKQVMP